MVYLVQVVDMKLVQFDQLNGSVEYEQIAYQLQKSMHMVE